MRFPSPAAPDRGAAGDAASAATELDRLDALVADGDVAALEAALAQQKRPGWALWGLPQAEEMLGRTEAAATRAAFARTWAGDPALLTLDRL